MIGQLNHTFKTGFAEIEFYHPSHNSMDLELLIALKDLISEVSLRKDVNAILLKSGGDRSFCAGANFDELKNLKNSDDAKDFFSGFGNVINAMKNSSKIIVGRIHGKSVGGGVGVIAACDVAFGTVYSSVRLSELLIGIGPFVIAPAVVRKIGVAAFNQLSLFPEEWKDAYWAKEKGLLSQVFENTGEMDSYIEIYLNKLANYNSDALSEIKKVTLEDAGNWSELLIKRAEISGRLALGSLNINK
jgi:methylglutaconyl-CoA hydratase